MIKKHNFGGKKFLLLMQSHLNGSFEQVSPKPPKADDVRQDLAQRRAGNRLFPVPVGHVATNS